MLRESIEAALTPAAPLARRAGFVYEAVAFAARARRQKRAWQPHIAAAHDRIVAVARGVDGQGCVAIVGSGHGLETPLDDLARRFRRVVLVDLVFPRAVRRLARRLGSVTLIECDVSGVLAGVMEDPAAPVCPPLENSLPEAVRTADFVVSANILSQLPVRILALVADRGEAAEHRLGRALVEKHLVDLAACRGSVCLLTDFEREERRGAAAAVRYDLLYGCRPAVSGPTWWWDLAPNGEEAFGLRVRHRVMCGILTGVRGRPAPVDLRSSR